MQISKLSTGFHKYANVSVFAAVRPVRAATMWPSATALGDDSLARKAPRGATEAFPSRYAAPYGAQLCRQRSYPRLSPWARLCRPLGAWPHKNTSPYLRTGAPNNFVIIGAIRTAFLLLFAASVVLGQSSGQPPA